MSINNLIKRVFTTGLKDDQTVYDLFTWIKKDITLNNYQTGEVVYHQEGCEFPDFYSDNACNIIASKYFFRAVPETSLKQVVDRMVSFWVKGLYDEGLLDTKEEQQIVYDELAYSLINQMWAPNSPQWFNTGISKYGIYGDPDYLYYYDPVQCESVLSKDRYTRSQSSACFIIPIIDQLLGENSISDHFVTETKLFKGGSGIGTNFSPLRAEGEHLSSGGVSSGLMSFLYGLDRNAGAIKSGGTTRRAAKMVIVNVDHPEIEAFCTWKAKEEKKVAALGAAGYDTSMNGEAYKTVSGQNSNNSVRVNKEFMSKINDPTAEYILKGRKDRSLDRSVKAADLWDTINQAAWECADPGIMFDDTINAWNTCLSTDHINACNPCAEFMFLDNTACNLASINLLKFLNGDSFNMDEYLHLIGLIQMVLEVSIHWGQYPTKEVAANSYLYRPTGLGLTNYASLFLKLKIAYDSDKARNLAAALTGIMTGYSYWISALMAEKLGAFDKYEQNKKAMESVLINHAIVAGALNQDFIDNGFMSVKPQKVDHSLLPETISKTLKVVWKAALEAGSISGYRNAQVSVIAPTGTISFAMDCGATSIEPFFSHTIYKTLSDGSTMEVKNPLYDESLSDDVLATANEISPEAHVKMVAAVTPLISGSISKTVNLPNDATVDDVKAINELAYNLGCKAITVYRDGCKYSQPLNTQKDKAENDPAPVKIERVKPDPVRMSKTHSAVIGGVKLYITVGYYEDGRLCEMFISTDKEGTLIKGLLSSLSVAISYMLQYGIDPKEISQMLRGHKFEPAGFVGKHPNIKMADSIADLISKIIDIECGDYTYCQVKDDADPVSQDVKVVKIYGETCSNCGSTNLVKSGVCKTCLDCGTTTGCG